MTFAMKCPECEVDSIPPCPDCHKQTIDEEEVVDHYMERLA
jgi:hypothetical protein